MPHNCVGRARSEDSDTITALRVETYSGATEFKLLRPDLLGWNSASHDHIVQAGWDGDGSLVSTFQGIVANSAVEAEQILGVSVELDASCFPTFITGRAATRRSHARSGFNSVMRWHFLRATMAARFPSTLGLAYGGAPRLKTMFAMGYNFFCPERVWDPEVEPLAPPIVVFLHAKKHQSALTSLETGASQAIAAYPWTGPPMVLEQTQ